MAARDAAVGGVTGEATTCAPRQTFPTLGVEGLVVFNQTVCATFLVSQSKLFLVAMQMLPPKMSSYLMKRTGNIRICIFTSVQRFWPESHVSTFTLHKQPLPFYTSVFSDCFHHLHVGSLSSAHGRGNVLRDLITTTNKTTRRCRALFPLSCI